MCGIAGFIDPEVSNSASGGLIEKMLESIAHRGPDGRGVWIENPLVFGHNRLSIIDLSEDGNQPMHYYNAAITYNGEIYNYIEVREELIKLGYEFKTESDTEVILAAYRAYGTACVEKFVGMWAFAIWDKTTKELFCSRDRFGIKPFYYIHEGNKFYFGSEYKALKVSPVFRNELNVDQINRGLQLGWVCYQDETYYECLKSLPAACNLHYANGNIRIEKYWDIDLSNRFEGTDKDIEQKFHSLFTDSIRMHMRADVEVGGCLSGGIDSSSIASAVAVLFPELNFKTFTIYYEGKNAVDERPWVKDVLTKYPSLSNFDQAPAEDEVNEEINRVLHFADIPIAGSSPISQYFVMKLAKKHKMKVLLDGQGSDEYLAGYMHSFYRLIGGMLKKLKFLKAHKEFYSHAGMQGFTFSKKADAIVKSLLAGVMREQSLYNIEYKNYYPFLGNTTKTNFDLNEKGGSRLNEFLYQLTFNTSLPSLLHYEDRNSMAFSIESRVPFLDHRLVEFVFSLDDSAKFHRGITKFILRKSLAAILPETISQRRDKKGFVTPGEVKWLRGSLKHMLNMDYAQLEFLNKSKTKNIVDAFIAGNNKHANLVWRVAMLNHWLKKN